MNKTPPSTPGSPPRPPAAGAAPGRPPQQPGAVAPQGPVQAKKPYEEISAIFNGNEVRIRVPKSKSKPKKLTPSQAKLMEQCTCAEGEDACPEDCGFGPGADENMLSFQIPDDLCEASNKRTSLNSQLVYSRKEAHDKACMLCDVTPHNAPKGVKAQKGLHADKDVFLLKIGKQTDEPNRTGNIEVELVTPRAPAKLEPAAHACKNIQCEDDDLPCCINPPPRRCRNAPKKRRPRLKTPSCCH